MTAFEAELQYFIYINFSENKPNNNKKDQALEKNYLLKKLLKSMSEYQELPIQSDKIITPEDNMDNLTIS